jgi:CcmD family protein
MSLNSLLLFAGFAAVWIILFAYVYYLMQQVQAVRSELDELRQLATSTAETARAEPRA